MCEDYFLFLVSVWFKKTRIRFEINFVRFGSDIKIFSVKGWCDLEDRVTVRLRSLEKAPFDRSHTSSCSPPIVTMVIFCIVCEI